MPIADVLRGLTTEIPLLQLMLFVGVLAAIAIALKRVARGLRPPFEGRPILNKTEQKIFRQIEPMIPSGWRLLAQVSYGEMLRCRSKRYFTVNAKRADLTICDHEFMPVAVIEYQGRGHHGKTRDARNKAQRSDAVKREALAEAGIALIEIPAQYKKAWLQEEVDRLSRPDTPDPPAHEPRVASAGKVS